MELSHVYWIFPILVLYMIFKRFRLSDFEFSIILFAFLSIIVIMNKSRYISEAFEDPEVTPEQTDRNLQTLLELPGYIKTKIGEQIDGLIKDAKNTEDSNDDLVTKEDMVEDPDVSKDGKVDESKFNILKREWLTFNEMMSNIKSTNREIYDKLFANSSRD